MEAVAVAAAAGAGAAATAADPKDGSTAPALVEALAQTLLIGIVRLMLAAAALAGAIAVGTSSGSAALLFAAGAIVVLVAVMGSRRGRLVWVRLAEADLLAPEARLEPRWRAVARAAYPSTIGLTILIAIALPFEPSLAAVLAGILAGIGGAALGFAAQLAAWERQRAARVLAEPGKGGRIFEAPR